MKKVTYKTAMDYSYLLIVFMACIDQGDGRWKEKERENLRHNIQLYKKMAEIIEREIESFDDTYPDERYEEDSVDRIDYEYIRNTMNHPKETGRYGITDNKENNLFYTHQTNITKGTPSRSASYDRNIFKVTFKNNQPGKSDIFNTPWPKFEDILLDMGRKYDWKNDRWIKVKRKSKEFVNEKSSVAVDNNSIEFHEKHKFSYRIVKLNKSKSRRNVVVAVSAVR